MNCPLASFVLLASLSCFGSYASAAGLDLPTNGWVSWEIPSRPDAPALCCFESYSRTSTPPVCKLDDRNHSYMNRDDRTTDAMRIYAHFTEGKLNQLRPLAADCPVQSASEIRNLSPSEQTSIEWFSSLLDEKSNAERHVREEAVFTLSLLSTERATHALIAIVQNKRLPREDRKRAIFWLAQTGSDEALAYLDKILERPTAQ